MSTDETYPRRGGFLGKLLFLLVAVGIGAFGAIAISRSDLLAQKPTITTRSKTKK